MDKAEVSELSEQIQQKLIDSLNWQNIKSVSCYRAIDSLNEIKTNKIIDLVKTQPQIKLTIPAQKPEEISSDQFDLIIVPCLGYDSRGYRLGWGGGFYDKFLASQKSALKIGLCFKAGHIKTGLPHESHDIPLDKVVTEI